MKQLPLTMLVAVLVGAGARGAFAAPAWGANCLSCHGAWQTNTLFIIEHDGSADPDESATGAPDRGVLSVFQAFVGSSKNLRVELAGLAADDVYAVQLKRLRFPGVEQGGQLAYEGDCAWFEWGEGPSYYSDPAVSYRWGDGPTAWTFDISVSPEAAPDYYDLLFCAAGKYHDGGALFYAEQHFYLRVSVPGDLDGDGTVTLADYPRFAACMTGPGNTTRPPGCSAADFMAADLDADDDVDLADYRAFADNFSS
jgi:hypothetical protein